MARREWRVWAERLLPAFILLLWLAVAALPDNRLWMTVFDLGGGLVLLVLALVFRRSSYAVAFGFSGVILAALGITVLVDPRWIWLVLLLGIVLPLAGAIYAGITTAGKPASGGDSNAEKGRS